MNKAIKTIGIVGGGQLGKMLTDAAHGLGFKVIILEETSTSPASSLADEQILGSYKDKDKVIELGNRADVVTFEIEGANIDALEELEKDGKVVNPSSKILRIIKDKFAQKAFLQEHDIPVAPFALIQTKEDCIKQGGLFGYPYLLKARFGAYDGRGNFVVKNKEDIDEAWEKLGGVNLYAEKFVPFTKEIAVISARDMFDTIILYPTAETVHKNNICHIVRSPAQIKDTEKNAGEHLAGKALEALGGVGVFAVEMFLTAEGEVLINEIAPRVHNSGHHTIEAFNLSQFQAHIRAIAGLPLLAPKPLAPHAVMVNILGERDGDAIHTNNHSIQTPENTKVHIYGKMQVRKERKMGHITAIGHDREETEERALQLRKSIEI